MDIQINLLTSETAKKDMLSYSYWFKTPLLIATEGKDLTAVQALLADANAETINCAYGADQITALMAACMAGFTDIALALLAHPDIDVNAKKKGDFWSPLAHASANGHIDIVNALLARPELDVTEPFALCFAAGAGHVEVVRSLLAHPGIDVNFVGVDESTALNCAVKGNHIEIVKMFLAHPNIDVKLVDRLGRAPLHSAALAAYCDIVELLLVRPDVDINAEDHVMGTPLNALLLTDYDVTRAATPTSHILSAARLLLNYPGVKVDLIYSTQEEPAAQVNREVLDVEAGTSTLSESASRAALLNQLVAAAITGEVSKVESLLTQHALDVNVMCVMDRTPLAWAAFFGHTEVVKLLLAQPGIIVDGRDTDERTPLALAAKHGHFETVQVLLDAPGALASSPDKSVFHSVLLQRDSEFDESDTPVADLVATLRVLVAHPAVDLSVLVSMNTPMDIIPDHAQFIAAAVCGYTEKVQAFLARPDINVNVLSIDNQTALTWASYLGHVEIVKALLAHPQISLQPANQSGQLCVALEWAVRYDHLAIVKALLARLDLQNDKQETEKIVFATARALLKDAVALGRVDVVKLLVARADMDLSPLELYTWQGRLGPERKLCEELVRNAHAERLTQQQETSTQTNGRVDKRRSWWEAFGLV